MTSVNEATLHKVPLFAGLDAGELAQVAAHVKQEDYMPGATLFACGDPSSCFYVIASGAVRIKIPQTKVQKARDVVLPAGAFFGEMGMLRGRPRMAEAVTEEECRLLRIDSGDFEALLGANPVMAGKVQGALQERVAAWRKSEAAAEEAARDPKSFLFLSPGGQEGASFFCANLAAKVAQMTGKSVLVLDFHLTNLQQPHWLGALSDFGSFSQIFMDGTEVSDEDIRKAAATVPYGVDLLAGTGTGSIAMTPDHLEQLLPRAFEAYDYVFIDADLEPRAFTDAIARVTDLTQLVLRPTRESAQRGQQLADHLKTQGLTGRIRYLLNRIPASPEVDPETLEFELGEEFVGQIPHADIQEKHGAKGKAPLVVAHPNSTTAQELGRVARSLLCMPAEAKSFSLWSLLGF